MDTGCEPPARGSVTALSPRGGVAASNALSREGLDPRAMVEQKLRELLFDADETLLDARWTDVQQRNDAARPAAISS